MPRNISAAPIDRALAQVLKSAYTKHGLTQQKLIDATGINETTMGRLFRGESSWSMSQLLAIADAIGGPTTPEEWMREAREFIPHLPPVSAPAATTDDLEKKRRQRKAAEMTVDELEQARNAAIRDGELESDEPDPT